MRDGPALPPDPQGPWAPGTDMVPYMDAMAPAETLHRDPPHNPEAEQALLGAMLVNNRAYERVSEFLAPEHFADPVHGFIYEKMAALINAGRIATPVTLKGAVENIPALDVDGIGGGAQYLIKLAASVVTVINAQDYGREIHECWMRRQLIDIAYTMANNASDRGIEDVAGMIGVTQADIDNVASSGGAKGDLRPVRVGLDEALVLAEKALNGGPDAGGLSTGISDLDRVMGPLMPGRLYVWGGRPAMGKSAMAVRVARNIASRGEPVAFFSLEMPDHEIASRLLAQETSVSQERQELGDFTREQFQKLYDARERIAAWPLHIDDTPASSIQEIRRRALRLRRQHGLKLLIVDYVQLVKPGNTRQNRQTSRVTDLTEITADSKALAKELDVPVIELSQLSRAVEAREDKRPVMADLRESGSIEQDADVVMFPYRAEYYLQKAEPVQRVDEGDDKFADRTNQWQDRLDRSRNVMEAIVAKRRGGRVGTARLYANMETGVITNGEF